jgi:hydrogenase-4 membrane subunit HyfE
MTRRLYALISSLVLATIFLLLSIMYVDNASLIIGIIMFILCLAGSYPLQYLLYPISYKIVNYK